MLSSILYGCEAWFSTGLGRMNTLYMSGVKCILGVRTTTPNDLCLMEIGQPSLGALVTHRQYIFYSKVLSSRHDLEDDPMMFAINISRAANTSGWRYIQNCLDNGREVIQRDSEDRKQRILISTATKCQTYTTLNPNLTVHPAYITSHVAEHHRTAFTQFRLSAHNLRVETGRWQRLPREERVCNCAHGGIQDEAHVSVCSYTNDIRVQYPNAPFTIPCIMESDDVCHIVYKCLKCFT